MADRIAPSTPSDIIVREVSTASCGTLKVFIQGNLEEKQGKTIFMTVHDIGTNHKSWFPFIGHTSMTEVRLRSIFLHVCIPGQEDQAETLPSDFQFPTLEQLGQDLVAVLDTLGVKSVIGMGEGAGANILCRFAINHPNRVNGLVLIHCTSTTAGVLEYIKDKMINYKLSTQGMNSSAYDYLVSHKFGTTDPAKQVIKDYLEDLKNRFNANNMAKYLDSFLKRTDLSNVLSEKLKTDALLVVGSKASHVHTVRTMHAAMNKTSTNLLVVDEVGDVISEAPSKVARALILFCKGLGCLSGVGIPGMERQRTLSNSMEEADRPQRRPSLQTSQPSS